MKILLVLVFTLLSFLGGKTEVAEVKTWRIDSGSVIEISGTTNISTFRCEATKYQGGGLLTETVYPDRNVSEWNGVITLQTAHFDCFNSIMTKDFRETLQIDDHPTISVRFINLVKEFETINQENLRGEVEITLAGVSKIYPISCAFLSKNDKKAFLTGERKLTFTDFEIEPPVKFLGTIKVRDSIEVNFALVLEEKS